MHDPLVVAHEIRRPWPKVSKWFTCLLVFLAAVVVGSLVQR